MIHRSAIHSRDLARIPRVTHPPGRTRLHIVYLFISEVFSQLRIWMAERGALRRFRVELANIYVDSAAQRLARAFEQASCHFRADVGFAAVLADLGRHFANHECGAASFERNGCVARPRFTVFANHAFHRSLGAAPFASKGAPPISICPQGKCRPRSLSGPEISALLCKSPPLPATPDSPEAVWPLWGPWHSWR